MVTRPFVIPGYIIPLSAVRYITRICKYSLFLFLANLMMGMVDQERRVEVTSDAVSLFLATECDQARFCF